MTGLLSGSTLAAPAAKKPSILSEACLDSLPESSLCISKKPHKLPSPMCQSHLHSLTGFHLNLLYCSRHQRIPKNDKCCCGRYSPWVDKIFVTGMRPFYTKPFTKHKDSVSEISLHMCVPLSISRQFSQGKLRPGGRDMSQCNNRKRRDSYFSWIRQIIHCCIYWRGSEFLYLFSFIGWCVGAYAVY